MSELNVMFWGRTDYGTALTRQAELLERRLAGLVPDSLILTEHSPVLTVGRGGTLADLLVPPEEVNRQGIQIYHVGRGGRITYHGPGQLVIYPVIHLDRCGRDVHKYRWLLEEVSIQVLAEFGLHGVRQPDKPGVWLGNAKIASIGIQVKKWLTMHGMAVNISDCRDGFRLINPCGINGCSMTSFQQELAGSPPVRQVAAAAVKAFVRVFQYDNWTTEVDSYAV